MKTLSKSILAACVLAVGFSAPLLRAEEPAAKEHGPRGDRVAELKEELGLTEAQVAKLKPIFAEEREAMKALRDKKLEQKEQRAESKKIRDASKAKVEAVLTPEQKAKFEALADKRKGEKPAK